MKKIIPIILLFFIIIISLTSCIKKSKIEGKYYRFYNDELKEDEYIILKRDLFGMNFDKDGKYSGRCSDWSDSYVKFTCPQERYFIYDDKYYVVNVEAVYYLVEDILSPTPQITNYALVYCREGCNPFKNN